MKPLAVDLCAGLGGWTDGLLAEGWDVVGFDIERHQYGDAKYPAQLVLQDIMTIDGRQFRGKVSLIVASPPCQEFSYLAMPWSRGKQIARALRGEGDFPDGYTGSRTVAQMTALFDACVRIGREAECPIVIENVRGAQPWVGRSRWNFGSFHLWQDVPALMPMTKAIKNPDCKTWYPPSDPRHRPNQRFNRLEGQKVPGFRFDGSGKSFQSASVEGQKTVGHVNKCDGHSHTRHLTNQAEYDGVKQGGISGVRDNGKGDRWFQDGAAQSGSKSTARKAASAAIAKIPLPLAQHIARTYRPQP